VSDINLYLLIRNCPGTWDTYSGMVVAAESEDEAFKISWDNAGYKEDHEIGKQIEFVQWPRKEFLKITLIGKAIQGIEKEVILEDYNAG